jgi:general secretion pathway protein A
MYLQYYGLRERPFDVSPDPRFLFLSTAHREALMHLRYGLTGRPGLTMLVGQAGTGKTTLVHAALHGANGRSSTIVHLSNPTLTRAEFYHYIATGFGFSPSAMASKSCFLQELEGALAARSAEQSVQALIVDEAQSLSDELLEEVRLLTNTQRAGRSIAVVLVGQPVLGGRLNDEGLLQLKQRVSLRCELPAFGRRDTAAYLAARVGIAGGRAESLFNRDAVVAIYEHSRGIPRAINVICDNALMSGFAASIKPIGESVIGEVCRDYDFAGPKSESRQVRLAVNAAESPEPRSDSMFSTFTRRFRPSEARSQR